jgi:hypothetical protein
LILLQIEIPWRKTMRDDDHHLLLDQDEEIQVQADQTIHDVLKEMEEVLETSQSKGDKRGYFAAIYQAETVHVHNGIEQNDFRVPT